MRLIKTFIGICLLAAIIVNLIGYNDNIDKYSVTKTCLSLSNSTEKENTLKMSQPTQVHYNSKQPTSASVKNIRHIDFSSKAGELIGSVFVDKQRAAELSRENVSLMIDSGAVKENVEISVIEVSEENTATLIEGMDNVTKGKKCYRMLPDGQKFEKDITIAIKYDSTNLPFGYTEEDIYTFFYNEEIGIWQKIERDSIDKDKQLVYSHTNHFTDYINGILKVPENSDAIAYTPTSIKDLKVADPMTGITLMSPPKANNKGTAYLSYPLNIPAGRRGMQPNLSINYNSSGGSTWLGLGWSLNVSEITIETRWGVPLYNEDKETETYLLDGETLVRFETDDNLQKTTLEEPSYRNPNAYRETDSVYYKTRVEGNFRKIVRYGDSPKNYYWKVIDRNGTSYYYGSSGEGLDTNSIFRNYYDEYYADDFFESNIAKWQLCKVVDVYGNSINYHYKLIREGGYQRVLDYITYTGYENNSEEDSIYHEDENGNSYTEEETLELFTYDRNGRYKIAFIISSIDKPDQSISYRNGFRESDKVLLDRIEILYEDTLIKEYYFGYKEGELGRTLLCTIIESDSLSKNQTYNINSTETNVLRQGIFERCNFPIIGKAGMSGVDMYFHLAYSFDYTGIEGNILEDEAIIVEYQNTGINMDGGLPPLGFEEYENINASKGSSWNIGGGLDVGLGYNVFSKMLSAGGNYLYSKDKSEGLETLIDLNGDGYVDELIQTNGSLKYRLRIPTNDNQIKFSNIQNVSSGPKYFQHSEGSTNNWGAEVNVVNSCSYAINWSYTKNTTDTYFSDVNADGLADIISDGRVYINTYRLNGQIGFSDITDSTNIPVVHGFCGTKYITNDNAVSPSIFQSENYTLKKIVCDSSIHTRYDTIYETVFVEYDTLYKARFKSHIKANGDTVYKYDSLEIDTVGNTFCTTFDRIVTEDKIVYDYNYTSPGGYDGEAYCIVVTRPTHNQVMRIDSVSSVVYDSCWEEEESMYYELPKSYSPDIDLVRLWIAPFPGIIRISGLANLSDDFSEFRESLNINDGVSLSIQKNDSLLNYHSLIPDSSYDMTANNVYVNKGDRFYFRINSNGTREYDKVNWNPKIAYQSMFDGENLVVADTNKTDANGDYVYIYDYGKDFLLSDKYKFKSPVNSIDSLFIHLTSKNDTITEKIQLCVYKNGIDIFNGQKIYDRGTVIEENIETNISMNEDDSLIFVLHSLDKGQLNWSSIEAFAMLRIESSEDIDVHNSVKNIYTGEYNYVYYPTVYKQAYDYQCSVGDVLSINQNVNSFIITPLYTGITYPMNMSIKSSNLSEPIIKRTNISSGIPIIINESLLAENDYYVEYYTKDTVPCSVTSLINLGNSGAITLPSNVFCNYPDSYDIYGSMYRNWGQFGYKGLADTNNILIYENLLVLSDVYNNTQEPEGNADTTLLIESETPETNLPGCYNPLQDDHFFVMNASMKDSCWLGYGDIIYAKKEYCGLTNISEANDTTIDKTFSPLPVAQQNSRILAVHKQTYTKGKSTSGNIGLSSFSIPGIPPFSHGKSKNKSTTRLLSDYMDMNGDRFPDVISESKIHYSISSGGLSEDNIQNNFGIDTSYNIGRGATYGASFLDSHKELSNNPKTTKSILSGVSVNSGGNVGNGSNNTVTSSTILDLNGDGLPDKIYSNGRVYFNTGYGWEEDASFLKNIRKSISNSGSAGISAGNSFMNKWNTSLSGGLGFSATTNNTDFALSDINGDGLVDLIQNDSVRFNKGKSFSASIALGNAFDKSVTTNIDGSLSLSFGVTIGFFPVKIVINPKGGKSWNRSLTKSQWIDMNNDGAPDYVYTENGSVKVRYSKLSKVNLLKHVNSVIGSEYFIDYELSENSSYSSQRYWNMSRLRVFDGYISDGADTSEIRYEYKNRYYDVYERSDYGYDTVITNEYSEGIIYRKYIQAYHNRDFMFQGLKKYDLIINSNNAKYIENEYDYRCAYIYTGDIADSINSLCMGSVYPVLSTQTTRYYEQNSSPHIVTQMHWIYGRFGNVVTFENINDTSVADDDINSNLDYTDDSSFIKKNLLSLVTDINIFDNNAINRHRTSQYDTNGSIILLSVYNDNIGDYSIYNYEYDRYGNISKITFPENYNGDRVVISYEYDNRIHSLITKIKNNSLGYESSSEYDYKFAVPLKTIDIAGNETEYTYDLKGRVKTIRALKEISNNIPYTIKYDYWDGYRYSDVKVADWNRYIGRYTTKFAKTSYYDINNSGNDIVTICFSDGLGRIIQVRKDLEVTGVEKHINSGKIIYDNLGRTVAKYYPTENIADSSTAIHGDGYFVQYKADSNYYVDTTTSTISPTRYSYDILDRNTAIYYPDTTTMYRAYGVLTDGVTKRFLTSITDPNGNLTKVFTDPRQLTTKTINAMQGITTFYYDGMGQLVRTIDPENNATTYTYDDVGHLIERTHPSSGTTSWNYDLAGNMTQQTQNSGESIEYVYNYNQLRQIHYSVRSWNDVWYQYGPTNSGNQTGRLIRQQDATGVQEFNYDELGNVVLNRHTYVMPNSDSVFTLTTSWDYDSWGRVNRITYPDKEDVYYLYDRGGNLRGVRGYKPGQNPIMYVDKIIYDLYGQKISEINGNGIITGYTYNPLNRRLTNLKNYSSNLVLQDNIYTYDNVGNIIRIRDNGMHSREQIYTYDALYRLIDSQGQWNNEPLTYETFLSYSPSGRIINKEMNSKRLNNTYGTYPVNYKNTYLYNPNNPYAVTLITNNITGRDIRFAWDSKGNMLHSYDEAMRIERNLCWTEDNRLQAFVERDAHIMSSQEIKNNLESGSLTHADVTGMAAYYNYDASGERNLKITSPNNNVLQNSNNTYLSSLVYPTLYASPLITLHHKGYTKHYFDGDRRICSKIGGGFGNVNWERVNDSIKTISLDYLTQIENQQRGIYSTFLRCLNSDVEINTRYDLFEMLKHHEGDRNEYEPTFYYHSDHLGSAAYLTNQTGSVSQTLNYLPFGEEWVDVKQDIDWPSLINYSFNAKEKDYESGLHYYGSRYYSSELSIWNSTDPMADKYPSITPYNYCANNPVKLIDPNGDTITIPYARDRSRVLKMINSLARGIFGIDKNGYLYLKSKNGKEGYSEYYRDKLCEAIKSKDNIFIIISQKYTTTNSDGTKNIKDVDLDASGGVTQKLSKGNSSLITISGHSYNGLRDSEGMSIRDEAKDILGHELVGHAIPRMVGSDTGNAVDNENKIRRELNNGENQQRAKESWHNE